MSGVAWRAGADRMATETEPGRAGTRRRGRRVRLAATVGLVAALAVGSALLLRATSLRGLPDVGDPFDVKAFAHVDLPDDLNAYTFYRRAHDLLSKDEPGTMKGSYSDWSEVSPRELEFLDANAGAMAAWLEGTKRDRGVYMQPGTASVATMLPVCQSLRTFSRLANLAAFRREHEGDYAGAWAWYRANLRSSRHSGQHGFLIERLVGIALFDSASKAAIRWSDRPEVDARLLRAALDDVLALDGLTPPPVDSIRYEYYCMMNSLGDSGLRSLAIEDLPKQRSGSTSKVNGLERTRFLILATLCREPERSRRVARLVFANWLSASGLPASERSRRSSAAGQIGLYDPAPGETPPISSAELSRWLETCWYANILLMNWKNADRSFARDELNRGRLIVHLAEGLYRREKGKEPGTADELVGPYLPALPVGYAAPFDDTKFPGPPR